MLTFGELRDLALRHDFPDPDTAAAIAMAESSGRPDAVGDLTRGVSIGLWQINLRWHPEWKGREEELKDPDTNADAAFKISSGGTDWHFWSTYNDGTYRRFMPAPVAPPVSGEDYPFVSEDPEDDGDDSDEGRGLDS